MAMPERKRELLMSYFERIRSLEEERKKLSEAISDEWKALKDSSFDIKAAREAYKRIYKLSHKVREAADEYESAIEATPLEAHIESVTVRTGDGETVVRRPGAEAA